MSRGESELDIVNDLKIIVLGKLRANKHKTHWRNYSLDELYDMLTGEVAELKEAITIGKKSNIALEAADIAAFCAMIINNLGETEDEDE